MKITCSGILLGASLRRFAILSLCAFMIFLLVPSMAHAATVKGYVDVVDEADGNVQVALTEQMSPVPTMQMTGLLVLTILLLFAGFIVLRRRRSWQSAGGGIALIMLAGGLWLTSLQQPSADWYTTTTTDSNGAYQFTNVQPNHYWVSAFKDSSYESSDPRLVIIESVSETESVATILVRKRGECPLSGEPSGVAGSYPASSLDMEAVRQTSDWSQLAGHTKAAKAVPLESEAIRVDYNGSEVSAIVIPIRSALKTRETQFYVSYLSHEGKAWASLIFSIREREAGSMGDGTLEAYPERISVLTPAGELIGAAEFDLGGEVTRTFTGSPSSPAGHMDWKCLAKCLLRGWNDWPWWLRIACKAACKSCFNAPNYLTCGVCIGCVAGRAVQCVCECWKP